MAEGASPLAYQWKRDGMPLPGATNTLLALSGVTAAQAGTYSITVSNALGFTSGSNALLIVTLSLAEALDDPAPSGSLAAQQPTSSPE